MTSAEHAVGPEEVMAFVDGELAAAEARVVEAHLAECAECAGAAAGFRATAEAMAGWRVEAMPVAVEGAIRAAAAGRGGRSGRKSGGGVGWIPWVLGGGGVVAAVGVMLVIGLGTREVKYRAAGVPKRISQLTEPSALQSGLVEGYMADQRARPAPPPPPSVAGMSRNRVVSEAKMSAPVDKLEGRVGGGAGVDYVQPMIARSVSLEITVQDAEVARRGLDGFLKRHGGYFAELNVESPVGAGRQVRASVRVPAAELTGAVAELKTLGRVTVESMAGEEVSQQHADLVARLKTARESEERFRGILQTRTGSVADVLEVEEEIARVRGEIEGMEAEQLALEHRVEYATVSLELREEYKGQPGEPLGAVSTRLRNAFVAGYRGAGETVLGIVLFLEEEGPSLLIWLVVLGGPVVVVWRRYRRMRGKV